MGLSTRPLVSGFTFIKDALTLGYPIKESILSIAPLCDEVIINVGQNSPDLNSDDGTYDYLRTNLTDPKFVFLKSYWDPKKTSNGTILAEQTDIALAKCQGQICQYIQGDEILHEKYLVLLKESYKKMLADQRIEGLVFDYVHFYGNVDIVKNTRKVYRKEVRTIRAGLGIKSWRDAQGFRHQNHSKLKVIHAHASIYHYGWCRQEIVMRKKVEIMDKLFHGQDYKNKDDFAYERIWGLKPFQGPHPEIMNDWITSHRNSFSLEKAKKKYFLKDIPSMISDTLEKLTSIRIGEYKNYISL